MNATDLLPEEYQLKQLTADGTFFRHHVHLDARNQVPEAAARVLTAIGFRRSRVSVNCFTFAGARSSASELSERMFDGAHPDTWTLKTDSPLQTREGFRVAKRCLESGGIQGYVESETVHSDRALPGASRPFDRAAFEHLCPRLSVFQPDVPSWTDAEGLLRKLPFVAGQRNLVPSRGERAPVLEFHLSVNFGMLRELNVGILLHAMGLVSYEVHKLCALPGGELLTARDGAPVVVCERPLTLRLANPGRAGIAGTHWSRLASLFLQVTKSFATIVNALGGFEEPRTYRTRSGARCFLYPVTFKLESLSRFYAKTEDIDQLPPVFSGLAPGTLAIGSQQEQVRTTAAYLEGLR